MRRSKTSLLKLPNDTESHSTSFKVEKLVCCNVLVYIPWLHLFIFNEGKCATKRSGIWPYFSFGLNLGVVGWVLPHPRRPRGSQSDREKGRDESFQVRVKEPLGTDSHRASSKNSSGCRLLIGHKKMLCIIVPNRRTVLSSFREFVHDGYCLDHGLSGSWTKEMHAVRKLSVWYKIPIWFQNTVCPKTKDAFPKI